MDWEHLEPDTYRLMNKHYTPGREGRRINKIVIHHNAGRLSIEDCWRVWQDRPASAHYQVETGGRIGQLVNDRDTAWHAGDWEANLTSIGIEHANSSSPESPVTGETLEAGAHLVAAVCKFYGLGRPAWLVNVFPHKFFSPTACPGHLAGDQNVDYMTRAGEWYDQMTGKTPSPKPQPKPARVDPLGAFPLPRSEYFGLITGPEASHGGYYAWEQPHVKRIQQALIALGFVPGITDTNSRWADGVFEQPTADAVAAFQHKHMPGTQYFGQVWWDDWAELDQLVRGI